MHVRIHACMYVCVYTPTHIHIKKIHFYIQKFILKNFVLIRKRGNKQFRAGIQCRSRVIIAACTPPSPLRQPLARRPLGGPRVRWVGKVPAHSPTLLIFISVTIQIFENGRGLFCSIWPALSTYENTYCYFLITLYNWTARICPLDILRTSKI